MKFIEVSNIEFDEAFMEAENDNVIYGTDYGTSFETLDASKEYGHMIFEGKAEALAHIKRKYEVTV